MAALSGLIAYSTNAVAVDLMGVRFQAGLPHDGQSLEASAYSAYDVRYFRETVEVLRDHPEIHFTLTGHASSDECAGIGCDELALRRARIVREWLIDAGIDANRLVALEQKGTAEPVKVLPPTSQFDRRVEIDVAPDPLAPPTDPDRVRSIAEVRSNVGALHDRVITVCGFAHVQLEDINLCPTVRRSQQVECLWINFDSGPFETDADGERWYAEFDRWKKAYDGRWITVRGTIDANASGHLGGSFAEIRDARATDACPGQD